MTEQRPPARLPGVSPRIITAVNRPDGERVRGELKEFRRAIYRLAALNLKLYQKLRSARRLGEKGWSEARSWLRRLQTLRSFWMTADRVALTAGLGSGDEQVRRALTGGEALLAALEGRAGPEHLAILDREAPHVASHARSTRRVQKEAVERAGALAPGMMEDP